MSVVDINAKVGDYWCWIVIDVNLVQILLSWKKKELRKWEGFE